MKRSPTKDRPEDLARSILDDTAVVSIASRDGSGWHIDWVSNRWEAVAGENRLDVIGQGLLSHFPLSFADPEDIDAERVEPGTTETFSLEIDGLDYGSRWGLDDDRTFWIVSLTRIGDGQLGIIAVDHTAQYRYSVLLEDAIEARRQLHESISQVVHELKQPISSIAGFAQLLEGEVPKGERAEYVSLIQSQAEDLRWLTEDLLTAGLSSAGRLRVAPDTVTGDALVEYLSDLARSFTEKPVRVVGTIRAIAFTDLRRLGQVVRGLIQNAVKYGGPNVEVRLAETDGTALVEVFDDGPGVAPDEVDLVFEPFQGASGTASKGTGIGLTVARALISELGGILDYVPGSPGARFVIEIPLHGKPSLTAARIDYESEAHNLEKAMVAYRSEEVRRRLNRLGLRAPLDEVIGKIIHPVMYSIGRRWQSGEITVSQEHHASAAVAGWLVSTLGKFPTRQPLTVVCACCPGNEHENGIASVAALVAQAGFRVIYLGRSTPVEALISAVEENRAAALIVSLTTATDIRGLVTLAQGLESSVEPGVLLGYGGRLFVDGFSPDGLPDRYLGDDPVGAVTALNEIRSGANRE